jgi:rhomboid protease GluP
LDGPGSIVCPACGRLIGKNERRCPLCGALLPGRVGLGPGLHRLVTQHIDFTALIAGACALLFALSLALDPRAAFSMKRGFLDLLSPGPKALYELGMTGGVAWHEGWWWTLLTAQYLHGGLLHILFNTMWIRQLGPVVEELFGKARSFLLFNAGGVGGFLVSCLVSPSPTIGASGAVFGLMGALIAHGRRGGSSRLSQQIWTYAAFAFAMGFLAPGVNNLAHAGGFGAGYGAGYLLRPASQRRQGRFEVWLTLALMVATAAGFVLSYVVVNRYQG